MGTKPEEKITWKRKTVEHRKSDEKSNNIGTATFCCYRGVEVKSVRKGGDLKCGHCMPEW